MKRKLRNFLIIAHAYQPPRNFLRLAEVVNKYGDEVRSSILSGVNERVYQECYKPVFVDSPIPAKMIFSFYGTLREWLKEYHHEEFVKIIKKIQKLAQREYYVLCDTYLHPILPLMKELDQDMLVKIGKRSFENDFGFTPKGFWLPELAVSHTTLKVLFKNGFEFVVLRDDQIKNSRSNPMYVDIKEKDKKLGEMAIIHFNKRISEAVWFDNDTTIFAEKFLQKFPEKSAYMIGTDMELYGHLLSYKDQFLSYVTKKKVLSQSGFGAFDVVEALQKKHRMKTAIRELSSWSCSHGIKRWTGECLCDTTDRTVIRRIKALYQLSQVYNKTIDERLDLEYPLWRDSFINFFLVVKKALFECGSVNREIDWYRKRKEFSILQNKAIVNLFKAKLAILIAQTSCFAFFRDSNDRPERDIAQINLEQVQKLLGEEFGAYNENNGDINALELQLG